MSEPLSIGDLSRRTGVRVVTIRYFEKIGLMPEATRTAGQQRRYDERHVRRLGFIRHARELGFSQADIRDLLELTDLPDQSCAQVHEIADRHLSAVRRRLDALRGLERELVAICDCHAAGRVHDCNILEAIGDFEHVHCSREGH